MKNQLETDPKNRALPLTSSFVMGFAIGGAIALLFTPLSGRHTRERVKNAVAEGKAKVVEGAEMARNQTTEALNSVAAQATSLVEQGKNRIVAEGRRIATAAQAGKEAYQRAAGAV
jgi:gas vesicle protein